MVQWPPFVKAVQAELGVQLGRDQDAGQYDAVTSPASESLFLVAGPGTGKTTALVLRILKLVYVDGADPATIVATTFTRRAASELSSRVLGWGDRLRRAFLADPTLAPLAAQLRVLDFNQVTTGTLDSIAQEVLTRHRPPGGAAPSVVEDFVSQALMTRVGLFQRGLHRNAEIRSYVERLRGTAFGMNVRELAATLGEIKDRVFHDDVDLRRFRASSRHPGAALACDAIDAYLTELRGRLLFDYALLERIFYESLGSGLLGDFLKQLRFVLVDEYQDTNLLQEQIYFRLACAAATNGGSITVVGDDDQSLYRFRGATVDLFTAFPTRIARELGVSTKRIFLSNNYRSTPRIVELVNDFAHLDRAYQAARVADKPSLVVKRSAAGSTPYPVLGLFRPDVRRLARDLARLITDVVCGGGVAIRRGGDTFTLRLNPGGTPSDIALLCSSPAELSFSGDPRLPLLLRTELGRVNPPLALFNPRGQSLEEIPDVQRLSGLVLECIDPGASVQSTLRLPNGVQQIFAAWRTAARTFVRQLPPPTRPASLDRFVNAWQARQALRRSVSTRQDVPLGDLVYKLVTWLPKFQIDIEGIVHLEAITRTITQSALFGTFGGEIIFDPRDPQSQLANASVREAIWTVLVPIASGALDLNEDLLDTLPADRVNVLSVHQAKGLQFPFVIVDVGSDFRTNHHTQRFKRFPDSGGKPCNLEDALRPFSPLPRGARSGRDRAFDDLIRQYYVAFSRPQDALLLVGLDSVRMGIENVATGWTRTGQWRWGSGLPNLVHL